MRIKLAVLEQDDNYLKRITSVFNTRFADKLELFAYTEMQAALSALKVSKIDVFLVGDEYELDMRAVPERCGFAWFVDEPVLKEFRGQKTICRFQQAEVIYKQVLNLYAEKFQGVIGGNGNTETVLWWFTSAGGGCGGTTAAASAAIHFAEQQKKVLYLELDEFGSAEQFFHGNGQTDMNDLIYVVKGRKKNIPLKLESAMRKDEMSGVCFYKEPSLALDLNELNEDDITVMLCELRKSGLYDIIVINRKLSLNGIGLCLWKETDKVIMVTDGTDGGNNQFLRALESMKILANQKQEYWLEKLSLIYNKFDNGISRRLELPDVMFVGSIPLYEHATIPQILQNAALLPLFNNLLRLV